MIMTDDRKPFGVTIKSPGASGFGAQMFANPSGEEIHGISEMTVRFVPNDYVRVEAELFAHAVEVAGAAAELLVKDPGTGALKAVSRIEFADGSCWDVGDLDVPADQRTEVVRVSTIGGVEKRMLGKVLGD